MQSKFVEIDGNLYQGGGQMIRSSIVLSTLLNKPFHIHSIRANRPNPGINNQLRTILSPFMQKPPAVGKTQLEFTPTQIPKLAKISANTSASCTLMMQCLLPIAVFTGYEGQTIVEGGTDVMNSPPSRVVKKVLAPLLARMGIILDIIKVKSGYYPKGRGFIQYTVKLTSKVVHKLQMIKFSPPTGGYLKFYSTKDTLPEQTNEIKKEIKNTMRKQFGEDLYLDYQTDVWQVKGTKTENYGISLVLTNDDVVWDCGIVGKQVKAKEVIERLSHEIENKGCLDEHHQDQLLIYMALGHGVSKINIGHYQSDHTKSMIYVLKQFIPELKIEHQDGILTVQGIEYSFEKYHNKQPK